MAIDYSRLPSWCPLRDEEKKKEDDAHPFDAEGRGVIDRTPAPQYPKEKEDYNPLAGPGTAKEREYELGDPEHGATTPLDDWEEDCTPCDYAPPPGMTQFEWECMVWLTEAERRKLSDRAKVTTIVNRRGYWGGAGYIRNPRYVHPEMYDD